MTFKFSIIKEKRICMNILLNITFVVITLFGAIKGYNIGGWGGVILGILVGNVFGHIVRIIVPAFLPIFGLILFIYLIAILWR